MTREELEAIRWIYTDDSRIPAGKVGDDVRALLDALDAAEARAAKAEKDRDEARAAVASSMRVGLVVGGVAREGDMVDALRALRAERDRLARKYDTLREIAAPLGRSWAGVTLRYLALPAGQAFRRELSEAADRLRAALAGEETGT